LVADSLEADWNEKLRQLSDAQAEYARQRENDRLSVSDEQRACIAALASDFHGFGRIATRPIASASAWSVYSSKM
jgi:hypothetical protein